MKRPRLLIARAEPEASLTAAQVTQMGGTPILAPMRNAIPVMEPVPTKPDALVATSARAFQLGPSIPDEWHDLPCLVVGEITATAARGAGFRDIRIAQGEAASLAPLLGAFHGQSLVYLAGDPRRPELESDAKALAIRLTPWLRYRMQDMETLPAPAHSALSDGTCDAILHFSRESAATLLRLVEKAGLQPALLRPVHACLSPGIAASLRERISGALFVIAPARSSQVLIETALHACRSGIPHSEAAP